LTGRHGNKGIISLIEKDELMPRTPWGERLEILLNPLGIVGRMNVGQLYELYCGLIAKDTAVRIIKSRTRKEIVDIFNHVLTELDVDEKKEYSKRFISNINSLSDSKFKLLVDSIKVKGFVPVLAPPFKSPTLYNIRHVLKSLNLQDGYNLILPEYNTKTVFKVPVGYLYMNKLEHIGSLKLHARSSGRYNKFQQPTAGKRMEGGQRFGEYDTYATISYDCKHLLSEMMGPLSDDRASQNEMASDIIQTGKTQFKDTKVSMAREQLAAYFISLLLDKRKV
jgi:DNA-directed RNA polymerase subunit beta